MAYRIDRYMSDNGQIFESYEEAVACDRKEGFKRMLSTEYESLYMKLNETEFNAVLVLMETVYQQGVGNE